MRRPVIFAGMLVVLCLSVAVAQVQEPVLPPDLKIIPPGPGVSPRLAQLSGIWEGAWEKYKDRTGPGGTMRHFKMDATGWGLKIAILEINPPNVKAVYASPEKSFQVKEASVAGDAIVLRWGKPGEKKTLTLSPTANPKVAEAKMEIEGKGKPMTATLRKN